jgi:hypothetical protein
MGISAASSDPVATFPFLARRVVPLLLAAVVAALGACGGNLDAAPSGPTCASDTSRPSYNVTGGCGDTWDFTFNGTPAECADTDGGYPVLDSAGHVFEILPNYICQSLCSGGPGGPDAGFGNANYCTLTACEALSGVDPVCQPGETVLSCTWGECGF